MNIFDLFKKPDVKKLKAKNDVSGLIKALRYKINSKDETTLALQRKAYERANAAHKVRNDAIKALGELGDKRAIEPLLQVIKNEKFYRYVTCLNAAKVIAELDPIKAIDPLCNVLKENRDYDLRSSSACEAATILGQLKNRKAVKPLIEALQYEEVQDEAAMALGQIGDKRAIEPLKGTYNSGAVVDALTMFGESIIPTLEFGLKSNKNNVRKNSEEVLKRLGWVPTSDAERISSLVASGNLEELVKMGELGIEPIVKIMRYHGDDYSQMELRKYAAMALGEIGSEGVLIPLIEGLQDKNGGVQNHAAIALGEMKHPSAVEPLIKALRYPDDSGTGGIRTYAANALGKIGDQRAVEPLTTALKDEIFEVRYAAAFALEKMSPNSQWSKMLETLRGLKPTTKREIERLREKHVTSKTFADPSEVINNIQDEYESYFRISSTSETQTSLALVFDNYLGPEIDTWDSFDSAPATKELETTIVTDGSTFYVFHTGTFL